MITSNDCDMVACDAEQAVELDEKSDPNVGTFEAPGFNVQQWTSNASSLIGATIRWDLLNAKNQSEISKNGCNHGWTCTPFAAQRAHMTWPAGRLSDMLNFLDSSVDNKWWELLAATTQLSSHIDGNPNGESSNGAMTILVVVSLVVCGVLAFVMAAAWYRKSQVGDIVDEHTAPVLAQQPHAKHANSDYNSVSNHDQIM
jgi:hypothetical protein